MDTRRKRTRHSTVAAAVALCLCATGAAVAEPLHHPAPPGSTLLTDHQLSELRGRYVDPGRILYFGIEMSTQWHTASGELTTSGLNFSVDRNGNGFVPTVTVVSNTSVQTTATPQTTPEGQASIGGNAFNDVKGITQVTQVSGNGNGGHNVIDLSLRNVGESGGTASSGAGVVNGTSTARGSDGSTAVTTIGNNQIGVMVNIPGQGQAVQTISGFQGIRQQLQIGGNMNNVVNTLRMSAGFAGNTNSSVTPAGISTALNQLKGLTQVGRY